MFKVISYLLFLLSLSLSGQINLVPNPGFELNSGCPTGGAQWNVCNSWNNVNMNTGIGLWGTPDYFNSCGSGGTSPPATFAGTCSPHAGSSMMALVVYNVPYPNYREYLATQLSSPMQPGTTYTLSFWLSNGSGVKSPWTIQNIGVCFSSAALAQSGWGLVNAVPQCEVTSNIASSGWTNYTFTISPTATWSHLTIGAFRNDLNNNPTMTFPNPGGPASSYANYFLDDVSVMAPSPCPLNITPSSTVICFQGPAVTLSVTGANSYTWSPSSSLSASTGSVVTANPSVTTTYTITGLNGACISQQTITINVFPPLTITTPINPVQICPGQTGTISAGGASTYTWYPGGITGSAISVSPSVNTVYTVMATDASGCQASKTVSVLLYPAPNITVTPSSTLVCSGTSVSIILSGAAIYTIQPGGNTGTGFVVSPQSTSVYTFTGLSGNGCSASASTTIQVNPAPGLSISPAVTIFCDNLPLTFTASGAATYTWFPAGSQSSVLTVLPPLSTSVYTLSGSSLSGCTATVVKSITLSPSPTLTAVSNVTSVCAGASATLSASGALSYTWLPGNAAGQTVAVSPLSTTIYTVSGQLNACISSATVLVANPLNPTVSSSGNIDCQHSTPQLFVSANGGNYTILWSGPGISGPLTTSVITANAAGIYSVLITDTVANCSATSTVSVLNLAGTLPFTVTPSGTFACFPGPATNLLISTSANYTWFPPAMVTPSTGPLVAVNPDITTTYTVLANQGACTGSAVVTISVNPTPTLSLVASELTVCAGQPVQLTASGAEQYVWFPGNRTGSTVTLAPVVSGVYTVTGTSDNCSAAGTITVNVFPAPLLSVSALPFLICAGDTATLAATGNGDIIWTSPGFSSTASVVSVNPYLNTLYTAICTDTLGCTSSSTVMVNVNSGAPIFAQSSTSLICADETVSLTANGAADYTWLPGALTGSSVAVSPSVSTVYTVVAQSAGCLSYTTILVEVEECVRTVFGVTNASEKPIPFGAFYKINFSVTIVNSSFQNLNNVLLNNSLQSTFVYPCTYTVIASPKITSHASLLKANALFDGISQLSLTLPDESTLPAGKRDTIIFSVLVNPHGFYGILKNTVLGFASLPNNQLLSDSSNNGFAWDPDLDGNPTNNNEPTPIEIEKTEFFIPEGFSPDGDGQHDFFVIEGLNGRQADLTVFNRWGNKVYENDDYDNTWDGLPNAKGISFGQGKLPEGTYYYILRLAEKEHPIYGFVVLRYD